MTDNQYGILIETVESLKADVMELKSLLMSNMELLGRLRKDGPVNPE